MNVRLERWRQAFVVALLLLGLAVAGTGSFRSLNGSGFDVMSLAVGADGSVYRAGSSLRTDGSFGPLLVQRFAPSGWVTLGEVDAMQRTADGQLLAGKDVFWVHRDSVGGGQEFASSVRVERWNGTAWIKLGLSLCRDEFSSCGFPTVGETGFKATLDATGQPVVAFAERSSPEPESPFAVFVKRWNGKLWQALGSVRLPSSTVPLEVMASSNTLRIAVLEPSSGTIHLRTWTGKSWQAAQAIPGTPKARVALAFNGRDRALIAWQTANQLRVRGWNGQWLEPMRTFSSRNFALASRAGGRPVLAWVKAQTVTLMRWDARAFTTLGTLKRGETADQLELRALAVDAKNNPLMALRTTRVQGSTVEFTGFSLEQFLP